MLFFLSFFLSSLGPTPFCPAYSLSKGKRRFGTVVNRRSILTWNGAVLTMASHEENEAPPLIKILKEWMYVNIIFVNLQIICAIAKQ